ncbi:hypothetical protein LUW74_02570 [Actinomadura madurae]|nr:hypothetical protein [Actinomadura madurae]URN02367.1 hypothetical protein LUW74_02570 [Actinomadura madurae]
MGVRPGEEPLRRVGAGEDPGLDRDPRSKSASATSSAPSSWKFTDAWSGRTVQDRTSAARSPGSAAVQAPVVTPTWTPGVPVRTAVTVSATWSGAMVSAPAASFGCT